MNSSRLEALSDGVIAIIITVDAFAYSNVLRQPVGTIGAIKTERGVPGPTPPGACSLLISDRQIHPDA